MAVVHLLTIVAVLGGLLISFRYKRFRPWEAGALIAVVVLWSYYGNCPFTIIEQHWRELAGETGVNLTSVGFLPYYAHKLMNIELTSRLVQQSTFFTGGIFFAASIDWLAPFFHMEIFKVRRMFGYRSPRRIIRKARA